MPPTKNRMVLCEIETAFATLNFLDRIKLATINRSVFFVLNFDIILKDVKCNVILERF